MKSEKRSPFKYERVSLGKDSKETDVKEFLAQGEQNPAFKIVKEVVVKDLEEVQSKFKRAYDLLSSDQFGLKQYMPRTQFVLGENDKGEKTLFILQEKIKGQMLSEIIGGLRNQDVLLQIDDLLEKAMTVFTETRDKSDSFSLPLAIPSDFVAHGKYVEVQPEQGVMPEVFNLENIIVGRRSTDEVDRIYLVDNHSVVVFTQEELQHELLGQVLDKFTPVIERLESSKAVQKYLDIHNHL